MLHLLTSFILMRLILALLIKADILISGQTVVEDSLDASSVSSILGTILMFVIGQRNNDNIPEIFVCLWIFVSRCICHLLVFQKRRDPILWGESREAIKEVSWTTFLVLLDVNITEHISTTLSLSRRLRRRLCHTDVTLWTISEELNAFLVPMVVQKWDITQ